MTLLRSSLFRYLLAWTLGALLVVWAAFLFFGYRTGVHEADELTDGHLASVASLLLTQNVTEFAYAPNAASLGPSNLRAHDYQQSLSVFIWNRSGRLIARIGEAPTPEFSESEGFETIELGHPRVQWRSFSRWDAPSHDRKISVMLSLVERDGLAEDIAEQVAEPGLWLLPVVSLFLILALRRGLRPLNDLSKQVHLLDIHRDTRLLDPSHDEFKAIVRSINTLIQRYNAALTRERELASEVAHELRTPLASISLNAASFDHALSDQERVEVMKRVKADAARAGAVMADLLALARASRTALAEAAQPVELTELARRVVAEYADQSHHSDHELALEAPAQCVIHGHPVLLEIALRNLIENAIFHTPNGTSVEVAVMTHPPALEVRDDGCSRGGGRTSRLGGLGFGLGHHVVRKIASVHHGRFELIDGSSTSQQICRLSLADAQISPASESRE